MRTIVLKSIAATALAMGTVSCAIGLGGQVLDGLQKTAARSPKTVSGSLLDTCLKGFDDYGPRTYPEGKTANLNKDGAAAIVGYFPNDPQDISKTGNLVGYTITVLIDRAKVLTNHTTPYEGHTYHIHCYYENINNRLKYLDGILTSTNETTNLFQKYNLVENLYLGLTGKVLRIH